MLLLNEEAINMLILEEHNNNIDNSKEIKEMALKY